MDISRRNHDHFCSKGGPIRTCLGCSAKKPKGDLVRIALDENDRAVWDVLQIKPGRGAYLCPSRECFAAALKRGRFNRAFRGPVVTESLQTSGVPWEA